MQRLCSACLQCKLKIRAFSSFIPFQASLDSVFIILWMLPAQKCHGSAVLPCCGASVRLCWACLSCSQAVASHVPSGWSCCLLWVLEGVGLIPWGIGSTQSMWSRPQFRSVRVLENCSGDVWTSCWSRQFSLAYNRYHPFKICTEWVTAQGVNWPLTSTGQHSVVGDSEGDKFMVM